MASPEWTEALRQAALTLAGDEINSMQGAGFLLDMLELMIENRGAKIFSADLCERLKGGDGWQPSMFFANRKITDREVAKVLENYGIAPRMIRVGTRTGRGYAGTSSRQVRR